MKTEFIGAFAPFALSGFAHRVSSSSHSRLLPGFQQTPKLCSYIEPCACRAAADNSLAPPQIFNGRRASSSSCSSAVPD